MDILFQVHFPECSAALQTVHCMRTWSFAYHAARVGPWEQYARDTERFHKRIAQVEIAIQHVFKENHRTQIFDRYFRS